MPSDELAQLELLSELDALLARLDRWDRTAPDWQPAETCRAMVRRLQQRIAAMRVRWESPLVVAFLGGTGTGKSALINALLGAEAVRTGRQRPTTTRPTLILRGDITPEMLGIDPAGVELIVSDLPILRDLVLVDCPDPDTTEVTPDDSPKIPPTGATVKLPHQQLSTKAVPARSIGTVASQNYDSNLARLRTILPHCDVLLVTSTQQKYRSARVAEELAAAAAGARLVFVQTHADAEDDIRDDWRAVLADQYAAGHIFFIDSLSALADAQANRQPRGEFADLVDLLLHELAGAAGSRIRRANFLDLMADTLGGCRKRLDDAMPPVEQAINAIQEQRRVLASLLAKQMHDELLTSRRSWENRLLTETALRWGLSPFALVLRIYQGLGNWALGALLLRARSPAQIALWGTLEGVQAWRKMRQSRQAEQSLDRAAAGFWDQAEIHKAGLILEGYATEAGMDRRLASPSAVAAESEAAGANFIARASASLQSLVAGLAARHTGWFTRGCYEVLFCAMIGCLLFRLAKNFFYDSWLGQNPTPALGLDFYLTAGFWLLLWCFLLIFALTRRLRRGMRREIDRLVVDWQSPSTASGLFAHLESQCREAIQFRRELDPIDEQVNQLRRQLALPGEKIGHHL
jgi:50S ribosome-binding GTPase